jgi:hypothetical protein
MIKSSVTVSRLHQRRGREMASPTLIASIQPPELLGSAPSLPRNPFRLVEPWLLGYGHTVQSLQASCCEPAPVRTTGTPSSAIKRKAVYDEEVDRVGCSPAATRSACRIFQMYYFCKYWAPGIHFPADCNHRHDRSSLDFLLRATASSN